MKDVLIINSYANTPSRRDVLINCINQLKKLKRDIILISNHRDDQYIQQIVDYYIYDSDNFLLPRENSPINWFADEHETIHIFHPGTSYIVYKNMCTSISFAKYLGYKRFFYLEFDVNFSDEDLSKIESIFDDVLYNNKMWMCNYISHDMAAYESRLFAGHVEFFTDHFIMIRSYDDWSITPPFSFTSESLEFIFPQFINNKLNSIYFTNIAVCEFFKNSQIDIFHAFSSVYIAYNSENIKEPLIFIRTESGNYEIIINNITTHKKNYLKNNILKHKFQISDDASDIKILLNDSVIFEESVDLKKIEIYKNECVRYKL
jgi:hypothetical protein